VKAKITKRLIDSVAPPAAGELKVWDTEVRGFVLRVRAGGSRRFVVEWKRDGRKRRYLIGEYGSLTADQARELARVVVGRVAKGEDPAQERAEKRRSATVADLAKRYMEQHAVPKKKPASIGADERILRLHVLPTLGRRKVPAVGLGDIADLHHAMRDKPIQANRMLALLSKMFSLAERWGLRQPGSNPCRGVDRFPEQRRERFLSAVELARLGAVLAEVESTEPVIVLAIRLLLLSGARRDEVLTLRWEHVDLEGAALNLPDSKTGKKRIPLGPAPLELLSAAKRLEGNPFVIPGRRKGGRLVGLNRPWKRIRARAGVDGLRLHDLRHGFASIGAAAGLGLPILGAILGHRNQTTTARYAHLSDDPLRLAAGRISGEIAASLNGRPAAEVSHFPKL
jgi:integrase